MNERSSLKIVKSRRAHCPTKNRAGKMGGTWLAPFTYDFTFFFVRHYRTISMKKSFVTGESEEDDDESHPIDQTFRDHESAGTASADLDDFLRASGVCRNLRGGTVWRDLSAEPEQRNRHTAWIWWTRSLRPA